MLTFKQFLFEKLKKNQWQYLLTSDKEEYADELISIVANAYKHTRFGSFVKTVADVKASDWLVLNYDNDPYVDVAIFYRVNRIHEVWIGNKIQGIGHDTFFESKIRVLDKTIELLKQPSWWIEASGSLASALLKRGLKPINDKELLKSVFPSITNFNPDGSYTRLSNNQTLTEYAFGNLVLNK